MCMSPLHCSAHIMAASYFITIFYLLQLSLIPLRICSEDLEFNTLEFIKYSYEDDETFRFSPLEIIDEEIGDISKDYVVDDLQDSLEGQVKNALSFSPLGFTETRDYESLNNNEDIETVKELFLNKETKTETADIEKIFDEIPKVIPNVSEICKVHEVKFVINALRSLNGNYRDYSMTREDCFAEILGRFKRETGWRKGKTIDWSQLDRTKVPAKYDEIEINAIMMTKSKYFRNPEITNNIHFKPYTEEQIYKKECNQKKIISRTTVKPAIINEEIERACERVLDIFRIETNDSTASNINWSKIDRNRLPEKYRTTAITSKTLQQLELYKDQDFMANVHFKNFTEFYSKSKRKYENISDCRN